MAELGVRVKQLEADLSAMLRYFGGDPATTKPEDFFTNIASFSLALHHAQEDNLEADRIAKKALGPGKKVSVIQILDGLLPMLTWRSFLVPVDRRRAALYRERRLRCCYAQRIFRHGSTAEAGSQRGEPPSLKDHVGWKAVGCRLSRVRTLLGVASHSAR